MDVDLANIMGRMVTNDKEVLVKQFSELVGQGHPVDQQACEFFLEMSNWNLQAAIGAYYDYQSTNQLPGNLTNANQPSMKFVQDVTIGEGESVPPQTEFVKTWRIQNNGNEVWPFGCQLRFVNGEKLGACEQCHVARISPGEHCDVSVRMKSPSDQGLYQGQWRMYTSNMQPFGDVIWVIIHVEQGGLLGVTQQFDQIMSSSTFMTSSTSLQTNSSNNNSNPFAQPRDEMQTNQGQVFNMGIPLPSANSPAFRDTWNWNTKKSPTCDVQDDELLNSEGHQLTSIEEIQEDEPNTVMQRQVSPSSSPKTRMQIEDVLSSPLAPSPIRPPQNNNNGSNSVTGKRLFE